MREFEYEKRIMGTEGVVSIIASDKAVADSVCKRMFSISSSLEERFSRFIPHSELSYVNEKGGGVVSAEFLSAVRMGKDLHTRSQGAFNPLVSIARLGYDADIQRVKGLEREGRDTLPYNIRLDDVHIDTDTSRVLLAKGQRFDMGGYMKGYAAEEMADEARGCQGVIVNLGGDVVTRGQDEAGNPFRFSIENPLDPSTPVFFYGKDTAIATSGTYNREWVLKGESIHHILDASGLKNPSSNVVSATVLAPRGHEADAFATVAVILGDTRAVSLLEKEGFSYYLILNDGSVRVSKAFPLADDSHAL